MDFLILGPIFLAIWGLFKLTKIAWKFGSWLAERKRDVGKL